MPEKKVGRPARPNLERTTVNLHPRAQEARDRLVERGLSLTELHNQGIVLLDWVMHLLDGSNTGAIKFREPGDDEWTGLKIL